MDRLAEHFEKIIRWILRPDSFFFSFQLLSAKAVQHGHESEGLKGFLTKDIKLEIKRASKLVGYFELELWKQ